MSLEAPWLDAPTADAEPWKTAPRADQIGNEEEDRASDPSDEMAAESHRIQDISRAHGGKMDAAGNFPDPTEVPFFPIPQTTPEFQKAHGLIAGATDTASGIANFIQSGQGIALAAVPSAPALIRAGVGAGFAVQGIRDAPEAARTIFNRAEEGDVYGTTMGVGQLALDAGMATGGLHSSRLTSLSDITSRRLLRRGIPDEFTVGSTPLSRPSVEPAATPVQPPSTTEPSVVPESVGTSNMNAPLEKNIGDMLMMSGGDHEKAATMAQNYGMADVAAELRNRAPAPVEAPAPTEPDVAERLLLRRQKTTDPAERQMLWEQAKAAQAQAESRPILSAAPTEPTPEPPAPQDNGFPMGPGKMTVGELPPQATTGIKRVVVDTERLQRGQDEIPTTSAPDDHAAVRSAEDAAYQDPSTGPALVERINNGDAKISRQDAAALLVERQRIINERTQWEERAGREDADPTEASVAQQRLQQIEEQLTAVDNASRLAGSEWSGIGRMYQRMIQEDYSLPSLERKARALKGGSLSLDELNTLKQQASDHASLQSEAAEKQQALEAAQKETQHASDLARTHEQTIKELQASEAKRPKWSKAVFEHAQKIVDRLKVNADSSKVALRGLLSQMNTGVDPTVVVHVANILAHKVGEFGLKKAEAFAEMASEYGDKVTPFLEQAWKSVKKLIGAGDIPEEVKKAVKSGVKKGQEAGVPDATARLKADAAAGDQLSHRAIYEIARAHIKAGVDGLDAVMKATHETVQQSYPAATEKDVRMAFSEYGKVKFPSKAADKVKLAEYRRITQLQLSIDRLKEGLDPLHTGLQRDKATQAIREKQAELNELLKQRTGPPSPEALAGRNEARKTALRNAIADLDKQLRTGDKPVDTGTPLPYDPEVERLTAERNAMKDKLAEIEDEANPPPTEAEAYNKSRMQQIERESKKAQARIDVGDYGPRAAKEPKELFSATAEAHAKLQALRDKIKQGQDQYKVANRKPSERAADALKTILHAPRNIAIFGHGTVGMFTHAGAVALRPTRMASFWQHFGEQFKLMLNERHYNEAVHRLTSDPDYAAWLDAKANIDPTEHRSDYGTMADELSKLFESNRVTRPLAVLQKGGNRGFFALKMMRMAMNKADWEEAPHELKSNPETAKELRRQIADTNNKATGTLTRGNDTLNQGARWMPIREGLFAPKLLFSKVARTVVDPVKTAGTLYDWSKGKASEADKYMALKRMKNAGWMVGTMVGSLMTNQAILSAVGSNQSVNFTDPTKSDWLAFKMGGKVISPYGGLLDILRFTGHLIHDFGGTLTPREARDGRGSTALNTTGKFLRSKLTPTLGIVADTATGYDVNSRPVPQRNERQKYPDAPRYSALEYALDKGPIPISQGVKAFYEELRKTGMSKPEALDILQSAEAMASGAATMALGATGIHAGEDYAVKQQPRQLLRRSGP